MMKKYSYIVATLRRSLIAFSFLGLLFGSAVSAYQSPANIVGNRLVAGERSSMPFSNVQSYTQSYTQSYAQNRANKDIRSKSDVVREVKQRYNADVLKISLNSKGTAYKVRVLMPDGRVRQITVSALR